ncbi:MAG: porin [Pseudomonadota bacterium]
MTGDAGHASGWSARVAGCAIAAATLPMAPTWAGENRLGATIYGQLNFGVLQVSNGAGRESYVAENPSIPSRVGIRWLLPLQNASALTIQLETGLGLTNLSEVSPTNDTLEFDFQRTDLRLFELIYTSDVWGRLSLGQGSMASDGASGADLSRTGLALGPAVGDLGGSTQFLAPDGSDTGVFVEDVFDDLSGLRRFRLRYDTPSWNGLTLSFAHGTDILRRGRNLDFTDMAVTYSFETDDIVLEAIASYEWVDRVEERAVASASLLHKQTGLNATVATGANQRGEGGYVYAKLGVVGDLTRHGPSAIAVAYYDGDDLGGQGLRSEAIGVGVTQNIDAWNLDLVAAWRRYDVTSPMQAFRHVDVVMLGARWQF